MKLCGLIGDPVEHSLSPVMQNAAFQHLGLDATYALWPTVAPEVSERIASLRSSNVLGANVTVPHKQLAMPECDDVSDTARLIGAVNTIINESGRLRGDNTDAYGFMASVKAAGLRDGRQATALVLGAGGAARAVIVGLQQLEFRRILLVNRTAGKARELADELGGGDVLAVDWESLDDSLPESTLIVNATSLGWHDGEMPISPEQVLLVSRDALVFDLTYRETDLLREAKSRGLSTVDGLEMLVRQGARSFSMWTGKEAPVDVMRRAVQAEQARRAGSR